MKAIFAKYIPMTDHKPARVKAFDSDGNQVTISWDDDSSYREAADALIKKMNWGPEGTWVSGTHGKLEVFVCTGL
jgi:hypothetical protein